MTEDEIRLAIKNNQPIDWKDISSRQKLSEEFIREFADKINWFNISYRKKVSAKFIKEFLNEAHRLKWVPIYFLKSNMSVIGKHFCETFNIKRFAFRL